MTTPRWLFYLVIWPLAICGAFFALDTYGVIDVYQNVAPIWRW